MAKTSDLSTFPPSAFWLGVEQFNQGEFYACHDTLEAIWMEADTPDKAFFQGILQIAVALYHLENKNWQGAAILLGEGSNRLDQYSPEFGGINVLDLLDRTVDWLTALQKVGPERVEELAKIIIKADSSISLTGLETPLPRPKILKLPE
ncbi:MAG: DUF309 domain-containing protein [Leptolyngbyaceae cyanobacterium MO_188.B28]|nr:DUF309 domain-containing protein [Leptolyngbyaceae cyanobacterium MO_188.B28]